MESTIDPQIPTVCFPKYMLGLDLFFLCLFLSQCNLILFFVQLTHLFLILRIRSILRPILELERDEK